MYLSNLLCSTRFPFPVAVNIFDRIMFVSKICLATILLSLHTANSYILLTANLDDVHSLAKQVAASPVLNQINDILRRAATNFHDQHLLAVRKHNKVTRHMRSEDEDLQAVRRQETVIKTENILPQTVTEGRKSEAAASKEKEDSEVWTPDSKVSAERKGQASKSSSEVSREPNDIYVEGNRPKDAMRRSKDKEDIAELGRNASFYLTSIKKIFENV